MKNGAHKPEEKEVGAYVTARVSDAVRAELARLAIEDRRSLSNYVRTVLEDHVERQLEKTAEPAAA